MPSPAVTRTDLRALENGREHFTDRYELVANQGVPVLRRGQSFTIEVFFRNGRFNAAHHTMAFIFTFITKADEYDGTKGVAVVDGDDRRGWKAKTVEVKSTSGVFKVKTPSNALVGQWKLKISMRVGNQRQTDFHYPGILYLLFHPWNKDDQVYIEDEDTLDEYIINDVGKIWVNDNNGTSGMPWLFGQFDKTVLPTCALMMRKSMIRPTDCGDPVKVCRTITYMVNAGRPGGVLLGYWGTECPTERSCTKPTEWPGSVPILEEYKSTNAQHPVSFGQCFNFAGVVTTVCRALGIPTRTVTNLDSAHDANSDLAMSRFLDEYDRPQKHDVYGPSELPWTFHVWNEAFMARPDLPRGYGGWQAIDATPQDLSEELYQCGPASVAAIKAGQIRMKYDVKVFLAATNADAITWKRFWDGQYRVIKTRTDVFGTGLLTKKLYTYDPNGETDREDIMNQYKHPEGTRSERSHLEIAVRQDPAATIIYNMAKGIPDYFKVKMIKGPVVNLGQSLPITFKVKNTLNATVRLNTTMVAYSVHYNGGKGTDLKRVESVVTLGSGQEQDLSYSISPNEYVRKLVGYGMVHAYIVVTDVLRKTGFAEGNTGFRLPTIQVRSKPVSVGQRNSFEFRFRNPLSVPLTGCKINYYAPGVKIDRTTPYRNIQPLEDVTIEGYFIPTRSSFTLSITFECNEIVDLRRRYQY